MQPRHKRFRKDRDVTFYAPEYKCHACNDSGIVHNSDGLLNNFIPDYDIDEKGHRRGGIDLAIVCWCEAAYPVYPKDENEVTRSGYRSGDGINNGVGIDVDKDIIRQLHFERKKSWQATADRMNKLRLSINKGQKAEIPSYITKIKNQLENAGDLLSDLR